MSTTETIPRLTAAEIEARFGTGTLRKGKPYAQGGSVFGARRQGNALKAQVWGTADKPYRVEVAFQGGAIAGAHCSCPVGGSGYCKHVVAVLLTWADQPEQFTEVEELDRALAARSKEELIDRLLSLGRTEEAVEAATAGSDYNLLQQAGIFIEHGEEETIEDLIRERATASTDTRLKEWLKQRYAARGDTETALALAEELFQKNPNYAGPGAYEEIRTLARQFGRWEEVRPRLLEAYRQAGALDGLIRGHLRDGEVDEALKVLAAYNKGRGWYVAGIDLEVARAAEKIHPEAAIEIYRAHVESLVAGRTRPRHQEAARLLRTIRELHQRAGEFAVWEEYIVDLRDRTRQLRAFKEELSAVGL